MGRRLLLVALLCAGLGALVVVPALAQQTSVTYDGPVTAGDTVTLDCPPGDQVQTTPEGPNASMTFYRNAKHKSVVAENVPPTATTLTSASWLVPRGAKWATGTLNCEPILPPAPTFQTITATGTFTGTAARVDCPAGHPYLWSVLQLDAYDPAGGPPVALGYGVRYDANDKPVGIEFQPSLGGWTWQVTLNCTDTWPQPPA